MDKEKMSHLLFQYASNCQFDDVLNITQQLKTTSSEVLQDAYLIQAQIKLLTADETLLADLEKAEQIDGRPHFPCLNRYWLADSPDRFSIFPKPPGALESFVNALPQVEEKLFHWYGEPGRRMVRQIHSEILYFSGRFHEAIDLAKPWENPEGTGGMDDILVQCVLFRSYLAIGSPEKAQQCMINMVRMSKSHPECLASYQAIRSWANLTTGWSGDSPRYYNDSQGKMLPALDDRLEAIRKGFSRTSAFEEPFVKFAKQRGGEVYSFRQYYMDVFHAIYWFYAGDDQQANSKFMKSYRLALASNLTMPFIEYGEQIIPLMQYVRDSELECSDDWISMIIAQAEAYEKSLDAYRM